MLPGEPGGGSPFQTKAGKWKMLGNVSGHARLEWRVHEVDREEMRGQELLGPDRGLSHREGGSRGVKGMVDGC